jgi:hypothetical protein
VQHDEPQRQGHGEQTCPPARLPVCRQADAGRDEYEAGEERPQWPRRDVGGNGLQSDDRVLIQQAQHAEPRHSDAKERAAQEKHPSHRSSSQLGGGSPEHLNPEPADRVATVLRQADERYEAEP